MKTLLTSIAVAATAFTAPLAAQAQDQLNYVLVSHAPDSDSWWNTIKNGIALAGEQMDVNVEYRNPPTGDLADMARIIEQAAASGPDGIITTLADFDVLSGPIRNAVDSGVDVIIINSGTPEQAREIGALGDAVVVGSAIVSAVADRLNAEGVPEPDMVNEVLDLVRALAEGAHGA